MTTKIMPDEEFPIGAYKNDREKREQRNYYIRVLYKNGIKVKDIAEDFSLSVRGVWNAIYFTPAKQGGLTWRAVKEIQLKNDDYKCQICGGTGKLHVHHIDKNRRNNKWINLITLCAKCHKGWHSAINDYEMILTKEQVIEYLHSLKIIDGLTFVKGKIKK